MAQKIVLTFGEGIAGVERQALHRPCDRIEMVGGDVTPGQGLLEQWHLVADIGTVGGRTGPGRGATPT